MNFDDTARFFGSSHRMYPGLFTAKQHVAKRMCRECKKREVGPRKKYCEACAKSRKREKTRRAMRKRRCDVRKSENSPIAAEELTRAENKSRYDDPKTSCSPSSFLTSEGLPHEVSEPAKINTAGGVA
jgi:hypothetical protein